jgi:DNA (cytosine-5)-methyltransferase 1
MRFGSVCSGIEAASVAFGPLGWKAAWFSEIEAAPSKLLKHHYPSVPNYGDMTTLPGRIASGEVEAPDLLCGGTPCQAFSVAGLRNSLEDARGNLTLTFCEIANAIDTKRAESGQPPAIIFYENVPGLLTTGDNAFGCLLGALAGEDVPLEPAGGKWSNAGIVYGPQRALAWRVLDAQHFGVPQRRKRLFVVACPLERAHPTQILFEFEGVSGDSEQGSEHEPAADTSATADRTFDMLGFGQYGDGRTSSTLKARDYKDATDLVVTFVKATNPHSADEAPTFRQTETAACLNTWDARHNPPKHLVLTPKVRKLMPVEYERLQGFPDGYTDVADLSDTARYKALGNSWAVPCVRWIGSRINEALK